MVCLHATCSSVCHTCPCLPPGMHAQAGSCCRVAMHTAGCLLARLRQAELAEMAGSCPSSACCRSTHVGTRLLSHWPAELPALPLLHSTASPPQPLLHELAGWLHCSRACCYCCCRGCCRPLFAGALGRCHTLQASNEHTPVSIQTFHQLYIQL
jgi:hypothetical protein